MSAHVILRYLANWKVGASVAPTAEEAQAACREAADCDHPFDVVILDAKGLGGRSVEYARAFREGPGGKRVSVILLAGLDSYIADGGPESLDDVTVLPKPVRPSELFNALVLAASDPGQRAAVPQFPRRHARADRPTFKARVLVAEDNPVNQEVATGMLEAMGCETVSAPNGRAAFQLFSRDVFDVVLMDCEMPITDGIDATMRIREIEAMTRPSPDEGTAARRTPIIALTAHALNDVREKCLAAGMDDFLVKPFDERQLAETLRRWLTPVPVSKGPGSGPAPARSARDTATDHVIDMRVIDGLRALDREGERSRLVRAVSRFVEITPSLAAAIHEHRAKGDADALWRAAHSLKSSAGALGAKGLSRRCAEIETLARGSGVAATHSLVDALDEDVAAAISGLRGLIGEVHVPA